MARVNPSSFDPVEPILLAILGVVAGTTIHTAIFSLDLAYALPWTRVLVFCVVGNLFWQVADAMSGSRRITLAIQHLTGPRMGLLGVVELLASRPDSHRALTELADQFGPIFKMHALFFRFVVVTDPVLATHCLRLPSVDKFGFAYSFLQKLLGGPNVLTGTSDVHWKAVRKGVAPAFSAGRMRDACQGIADTAEQLASIMCQQGGKALNVDILLLRGGIDYVGKLGFGKDMGALDAVQANQSLAHDDAAVMMESGHELGRLIQDPVRRLKLWRQEVRQGWQITWKFQATLRRIVEHMEHTTPPPASFAALLLATVNPATGAGYQKRLQPESASLFSAGADTTAHTITWTLFQLSQNPDAEAKVVEELAALGLVATPQAPVPRTVSAADLSSLPYLTCVIKETLRMYPAIGVGQLRVCATDTDVAGHLKLPAGTILWMPHHTIQNSCLNWDEPDSFIPERFQEPGVELPDLSKLKLPKSWYKAMGYDSEHGGPSSQAKRYFPFGEGPRNCLGQNFAHTSMLTILATLLGRLHFRLADQMGGKEGVRGRETFCIVTAVQDGMWLHAEPRA